MRNISPRKSAFALILAAKQSGTGFRYAVKLLIQFEQEIIEEPY